MVWILGPDSRHGILTGPLETFLASLLGPYGEVSIFHSLVVGGESGPQIHAAFQWSML